MMTKEKKNRYFSRYIFVIYLLVITLTVTGITLSRYSVTQTALDEARLAGAVIVISPETNGGTLNVNIGKVSPISPASADFFVINSLEGKTSEVAVRYYFTIEATENLPLDFTITKSSGIDSTDYSATGTSLSFAASEDYAQQFTLSAAWRDGADKSDSYTDEIDWITVNLFWEQID